MKKILILVFTLISIVGYSQTKDVTKYTGNGKPLWTPTATEPKLAVGSAAPFPKYQYDNTFGWMLISEQFITVATLAALKAVTLPIDYKEALVVADSGRYELKGSNWFRKNPIYSATEPLAVDGNVVNSEAIWKNPNISVVAGETVDFKYQNEWIPTKPLRARDFGAIANDGVNDGIAMQRCFDYGNSMIDSGVYNIETTLYVNSTAKKITGIGLAWFECLDGNVGIYVSPPTGTSNWISGIQISNIKISYAVSTGGATSTNTNTIAVKFNTNSVTSYVFGSTLENIGVDNAYIGFSMGTFGQTNSLLNIRTYATKIPVTVGTGVLEFKIDRGLFYQSGNVYLDGVKNSMLHNIEFGNTTIATSGGLVHMTTCSGIDIKNVDFEGLSITTANTGFFLADNCQNINISNIDTYSDAITGNSDFIFRMVNGTNANLENFKVGGLVTSNTNAFTLISDATSSVNMVNITPLTGAYFDNSFGGKLASINTYVYKDVFSMGGYPNPRAILELNSTNKGFQVPKLTTIQRDAVTWVAADDGMQIYNTTLNTYQFRENGAWVSRGTSTSAIPQGSATTIASTTQTVTMSSAPMVGTDPSRFDVWLEAGGSRQIQFPLSLDATSGYTLTFSGSTVTLVFATSLASGNKIYVKQK